MSNAIRDRLVGLVCAGLCTFAVLGLQHKGVFERLEQIAIDRRFRLRGEVEPSGRVVVIGITQQDMNRLGTQPWGRSLYAEAVRKLKKRRARTIALDIFFPGPRGADPADPDNLSPEDRALVDAVDEAGNVLLPVFCPVSLRKAPVQEGRVHVRSLQTNMEPLTQAAAAVGHINVRIDTDGTVRRIPAMLRHHGRSVPQIALAAAARHTGAATVRVREDDGLQADMGWRHIPLSHGGDLYANPLQVGRPDTFFTFSDLIHDRIPPERLAGHLVFVGQTALGARDSDTFVTPMGSRFGVFIQAGLADALLTGRSIRRGGAWSWATVPAAALLGGLLLFGGRLRRTVPAFIVLMVACLGLIQWAFESQGLLLEAVPTTAALATMMGASLGWMAVGARRRVLQNDQALHILKETGQVVNHVLLGMEGTETPHLRIAGTDEFTSSLVVPEKSPAVVVESIGGAVGALAGTIYFRSTMSAPLELVATHGLEDDHLRGGILNLDREIIRRIESGGMPIVTSRLRDDPDFRLVCPEARSILSVPLLIAGSLAGVVNLYNKKPTRMSPQRQFDADDLRLVSTMAHQAAVTLHNAKLYERVHKLFLGAITSLSAAIDAKDPYTRGHSERVAKYSRGIAEAMGLTPSEVEVVELSALLHDVGKIAVHDAVLTKPGRLTDEEWGIFRNHPARGVEILSPIEALGVLSPGIRHHHERFDGKGYPDGLAGEAIPLIARIICVADSYDAMTSDRSYRSSLGRAKALGELRSCAGTQFDPVAARVFVEEVLREPFDAPGEGLKKAS